MPGKQKIKKPVCIVTTMYKDNLSPEEEIGMVHLLHHLGKYDKFTVIPENKKNSLPGFNSIAFPQKYFTSAKANAELLFSEEFYKTFSDYEYILLYELDSLVLSDQLLYWCSKGYDYIGPPWIKKFMIKRYDFPDAVGNGGFALRRTKAFLKAIEAQKHPWKCMWHELKISIKERKYSGLLGRLHDLWANTRSRTKLIEDRWFSFKAKNYYPDFKVAPVEEGIKFAWEIAPREMMKLNGGKTPFGAHAWYRYDRKFWEAYLIRVGR